MYKILHNDTGNNIVGISITCFKCTIWSSSCEIFNIDSNIFEGILPICLSCVYKVSCKKKRNVFI